MCCDPPTAAIVALTAPVLVLSCASPVNPLLLIPPTLSSVFRYSRSRARESCTYAAVARVRGKMRGYDQRRGARLNRYRNGANVVDRTAPLACVDLNAGFVPGNDVNSADGIVNVDRGRRLGDRRMEVFAYAPIVKSAAGGRTRSARQASRRQAKRAGVSCPRYV